MVLGDGQIHPGRIPMLPPPPTFTPGIVNIFCSYAYAYIKFIKNQLMEKSLLMKF